MNLSLQDIEAEAFRNFAGKVSVRLGDLAPGLYAVRGKNLKYPRLGPNGCGKSTAFSDAPTWCLYGRTIEGLRTTEVKSWSSKKPARVRLGLLRDKRGRTIQRGPRASDLSIDDKIVGQPDVEALVGLSLAAWSQAVVWGQAQPLFFDLAPGAKMGLLSDALGLERWERRAEAAAARAKRLEGRLRELEGELAGLEAALGHAESALEAARGASERWGEERAERLGKLALDASQARSHAEELAGRAGEASVEADRAGTAAKLLRPEVEKMQEQVEDLQIAVCNIDNCRGARRRQIEEFEEQLRSFKEKGACPTCGQSVTKKNAAEHTREISASLKRLEVESASEEREKTKALQRVGELKRKLVASNSELEELERTCRQAESEQRSLERELAGAQAKAAAAEQAAKSAEEEVNPHREVVAQSRRRLSEIKTETSELEEQRAKLSRSAERAQFWVRGFRDIRLMIIDEVLDDLRETTAALLEDLGLGEWEVGYSTERETKKGTAKQELTVTLRSPEAPEGVRWEVYSGGERQRLRIAGALALSEVLLGHAGVSVDFRVLDEPTRGLSPEGRQDLVEMLATYAEQAQVRVLLIDHTTVDSSAFAGTITVVRDKTETRIEIN